MTDEIKAMTQVNDALDGLEPDALKRVLRWATDKFGDGEVELPADDAVVKQRPQRFERISDLMDAADPQTGIDHVLVATYWFQVLQDHTDVTGQEVNSALKDLGHESSNITRSFDGLKDRRPALARQVQKSGSTKQARKRYRLTNEGIRAVEAMLSGQGDE